MLHIALAAGLVGLLSHTCYAQDTPSSGTIYSPIKNCPRESVSASAATAMVIWPDQNGRKNKTAMAAAGGAISKYLNHPSDHDLFNYTSSTDGVLFWYSYLNDGQACDMLNIEGVDYVEVDEDLDVDLDPPSGSSKRAATTLATQTKPVSELRVISQPTDVPNVASLENYVFDEVAGDGITIYVVEDGVNTASSDLAGKVIKTLYAPYVSRNQPNENDESPSGHTTCVASKAVGSRYGVAKSARVVAVKMRFNTADSASVFDLVRQDIIDNRRQKRAIINVSWGTTAPADGVIPRGITTMIDSQRQIMNDLDVPMVFSAGNHAATAGRSDIDLYPQRFATDDDLPFINVGSVRTNGRRSTFSQGGAKLTVSAVGSEITCSQQTGTGSRVTQGTSFAAPQVVGLLAYFLSQATVPFDTTTGSLAKNAKAFMKDTASWSRRANGDKVAWNLITKAQNPPSS